MYETYHIPLKITTLNNFLMPIVTYPLEFRKFYKSKKALEKIQVGMCGKEFS